MNFILITIFLSVLQACFCYKLRRDIGKVKYYCNEICKSCGGEGELNLDVCVCNFEEDTASSRECLNRNRNKFDFLGIKWKAGRESIKKRSISISNYLDFTDGEPITRDLEQNGSNKQLFKRSYSIAEIGYPYFQWRIVEEKRNLRDEIPRPRMLLTEDNNKNIVIDAKGTARLQTNLDSTRFAANMFRPIPDHFQTKGNYELLLSEPKGVSGHQLYYLGDSQSQIKNQASIEDENGSVENSDYEDDSEECGDDNLVRLDDLQQRAYESVSPREDPFAFGTDAHSKKSVWESVSS